MREASRGSLIGRFMRRAPGPHVRSARPSRINSRRRSGRAASTSAAARRPRSRRTLRARAACGRGSARPSRARRRGCGPTTTRPPRLSAGEETVRRRIGRPASRRARGGNASKASLEARLPSASASLATARGSGWGSPARVASISAPDALQFRRQARERLPHRAVGPSCSAGDRGRVDVAPRGPEAADDLGDIPLGKRVEPEPAAARADRRQHLPRPVRHDQDQRPRRAAPRSS